MHQSALSFLKREQALNILLFLFPTLGAFTRHWISTFFWLISITAIYMLLKQPHERRTAFSKDEWIVLAGMSLFFLACLPAGLTETFHVSILEVEFKYLLFIPIYCAARATRIHELIFTRPDDLGALRLLLRTVRISVPRHGGADIQSIRCLQS